MKKARRVLLTMVIALGMTVTAFAEKNVLAKEVIDMGEDMTIEAMNLDTGEVMEVALVDCIKTVETLEVNNANGDETQAITLEGGFKVPDNNSKAIGPGGSTDEGYDDSISVKATLRIGFVKGETSDGVVTYLLEKAKGNWEIVDNAVTIYDKSFDVSCYCIGSLATMKQQDLDNKVDDDDYSFSITTYYDEPVPENDPMPLVGAGMECYVEREASPWYFRFNNCKLGDYE